MSCKLSSKEPFTAVPNIYSDKIKPRLTDTQRAICDLVIRMTIGWHRTSARISNSTFANKSGKSERSIITAKHKLIQLGLLVQLEPAHSTAAALFTIDLYYNDPNRCMKRPQPITRPIEQPSDDLLSSIGESTHDTICPEEPVTPELQQLCDEPTHDNNESIHDNTENIHEADRSSDPCETHGETTEPLPESSDLSLGNSDNDNNIDTVVSTNHVQEWGETDAPHLPSSNSLNIYNKQTIENAPDKLPATNAVQSCIRDVCYKFINLFPEAKDDSTWRFIGWCVSTYGQERCIEKLDYVREYRKLHPIVNPKGLLRVALTKDYQPSRWITGMIKARRKADAEYQRGQSMIAEMEGWKERATETDWEAGQARIKDIINMLGQKESENDKGRVRT